MSFFGSFFFSKLNFSCSSGKSKICPNSHHLAIKIIHLEYIVQYLLSHSLILQNSHHGRFKSLLKKKKIFFSLSFFAPKQIFCHPQNLPQYSLPPPKRHHLSPSPLPFLIVFLSSPKNPKYNPAITITIAIATFSMAESTPEQHQLESSWSFWYDDHKKSSDFQSYQQGLQELSKFDTLEDFWASYSHLSKPDTFPRECSVYLSRDGQTPAWETFPQGGCWLLRVRKKNSLIDRLWEELVFACISELFELPDIVCVGVTTRLREDVLSIWNLDNSNQNIRFLIGEKLRKILNLDETTNVEYKTFRSSIKDKSSFKNARGYAYAPTAPNTTTANNQSHNTANKSQDKAPKKPQQQQPPPPQQQQQQTAVAK